ncbi:MAG: hypothetical protein IT186_07000 [Acidobacteria bacterium]|nr:hypothetical protein [Acidobacteriota bacterium]
MVPRAVLCVVLLLVPWLSGCGGGTPAEVLELPRVKEAPQELAFMTSIRAARVPLPGRKLVTQMGYEPPGGGDPENLGYITIGEFEGAATKGEFQEARDKYASRYKSEAYGELEDLMIDGRPAWAYTVTYTYKGKVSSVIYTAAVPYETKTYTIEFSGRREEWQDPAYLRRVVASFEVPKKGRGTAIALMVFGVALGAVTFFYWKSHTG